MIQIALVVSWFVPLPNTTAWASDTFGAAAVQLAVSIHFYVTYRRFHSLLTAFGEKAIYPTVIIVLVSLNNAALEIPHTRIVAPAAVP